MELVPRSLPVLLRVRFFFSQRSGEREELVLLGGCLVWLYVAHGLFESHAGFELVHRNFQGLLRDDRFHRFCSKPWRA